MIAMVDEFILYDDVQYTKNDWRNRNLIKTFQGPKWLTIPVYHNLKQRIKETRISDFNWNKKHWNALVANYSKATCFKETRPVFEQLYLNRHETFLSEINTTFIREINRFLEIKTRVTSSLDYALAGDPTERLVGLCKQVGVTEYLSGPSAKNYLNLSTFEEEKIDVHWMNYDAYKIYPQLFPPFLHQVTVLDLIFNVGKNFRPYLYQ